MSAEALKLAIGCALASALTAALLLWLGRRGRRWRGRRGALRGHVAQREAATLLDQQGYAICAEEQRIEGELEIDGEPTPFEVRIDYVVCQDGRSYAVEVKSGKASSPRSAQTRRQLREYAALAAVDGLLLVDMERRRIHQLRFPEDDATARPTPRWGRALLILLLGAGLGALAVSLAGCA